MKILVVEDDFYSRAVLEELLGERGHVVTTVGSGLEAIASFDDVDPDLVIIDLWMPRMNGLECLNELQRIRSNVRVVMVTATPFDWHEQSALAKGVSTILKKPLDFKALIQAVEGHAQAAPGHQPAE